ncbi:GatB/YqeY domain-containing protein [Alkalicoccus chagannorensis]|uniref:GatB/YqeY domain-containing protein n=1 Tax=Alkalicoccus chagannorensis TaxID=427072 RepID=UPI000558A1BF|nr:GatB/YqeY domain-containing protein [Alkalicoccus chagannorensis]
MINQLNEDMKQAMRAKEKERLSVIRSVKSALQNEAIQAGHDLSEEEVLTVLNREMKQRRESLQEFSRADREDLASKTQREIDLLSRYLPEQMSDEELQAVIDEAVAESGASGRADMGRVMGLVMPRVKGKADGGLVRERVQQSLS